MTGKDFCSLSSGLQFLLFSLAFITFSPPSWLICRDSHSAINAVSYGRLGALSVAALPSELHQE